MMIKTFVTLFMGSMLLFQVTSLKAQTLADKLKAIDSVSIEVKAAAPGFSESYILWVTQPLDHNNPAAGSFKQRVFLSHRDYNAPMVITTEGYTASYANNAWFVEELAGILNSNQVVVEHRFFDKSIPDGSPWQYLTVEQAAADHHHIVRILKKIYSGKWVSTGISKGGSTCVYHRAYYPNDVDATVAYVAPFNIAAEDPREIEFLKKVGPDSVRARILSFQREVLSNRAAILPYLIKDMENQGKTLLISPDSALDFMVLEYPFSYWQWCGSYESIPLPGTAPKTLYKHLRSIIPPSMYSIEEQMGLGAFFAQAYNEVGYYGYDTLGLSGYLFIQSGYISNECLAPNPGSYHFDPKALNYVREFISKRGNNIIYIYGANDPWTASSAQPGTETNALKIVADNACHSVRIGSLNPDQRKQVLETLGKWIGMDLSASY